MLCVGKLVPQTVGAADANIISYLTGCKITRFSFYGKKNFAVSNNICIFANSKQLEINNKILW